LAGEFLIIIPVLEHSHKLMHYFPHQNLLYNIAFLILSIK
jgi:hypothetical protein